MASVSRRMASVARQVQPRHAYSTSSASTAAASQQSYLSMVVKADRKGNLESNELVAVNSPSELPNQDPASTVTVRVRYSNLNYKDGMIVQGQRGVVPRFPIVPGIDAAGTVLASSSADFRVGDAVTARADNSTGLRRGSQGTPSQPLADRDRGSQGTY